MRHTAVTERQQRKLLLNPVQTLLLAVLGIVIAALLAAVLPTDDADSTRSSEVPPPVKVPKAPHNDGAQENKVPHNKVLTAWDPCENRPIGWGFMPGQSACAFAHRLLLSDTAARAIYNTTIAFGPSTEMPIAMVRGLCNRLLVPLLPEVSYLENLGLKSAVSRRIKHAALRCIGDITRRAEPNRSDATALLAEAKLEDHQDYRQ